MSEERDRPREIRASGKKEIRIQADKSCSRGEEEREK